MHPGQKQHYGPGCRGGCAARLPCQSLHREVGKPFQCVRRAEELEILITTSRSGRSSMSGPGRQGASESGATLASPCLVPISSARGLEVRKVDIDNSTDTASPSRYLVTTLPSFLVFLCQCEAGHLSAIARRRTAPSSRPGNLVSSSSFLRPGLARLPGSTPVTSLSRTTPPASQSCLRT